MFIQKQTNYALFHFEGQAEGNLTPPEWPQSDECTPEKVINKVIPQVDNENGIESYGKWY